ncbi:hypothetical protein HDV05_001850, partial [Chytridiales sp. JEL 0842]
PMEALANATSTKPDILVDDEEDDLHGWAKKEAIEEFNKWLPLRAVDEREDTDQDPYRSVIFDDIRNLMFDLKSPRPKQQLIAAFVNLLSLQFNTCLSSNSDWTSDVLLHSELASEYAAASFVMQDNASMQAETDIKISGCPIKTWPLSSSTLHQSKDWLMTFDANERRNIEETGSGRREFLNSIYQQMHDLFGLSIPFLPALLSIEGLFGTKSALKLGKSWLKTHRMNIPLWIAYARLEASRGNIDEARRILSTSIKSYESFPKEFQEDSPVLHAAYADLELEELNANNALST